jgi:predicted DNA-binding transcriptional regulator AlpA
MFEAKPAAKDDDKLLWRAGTVARKLSIGMRTLNRWRAMGEFPEPDFRKGPKMMWWKPETVRSWIEAQKRR